MNKNKKLISLVCAIAMIFSMLSGLAITANAADKGYTVSDVTVSDDGTTASFKVGYTGFEGGITNGNFSINIPVDASAIKKVTNAKADILGNAIPSAASDLPKYSVSFTCALDDETFNSVATKSEDILTTITIEFNDAIANDIEIKIADGSYIATSPAATDSYTVGAEGANGITSGSVVLHNPNAPTPKPTTDATPVPVATEPPAETGKPVVENPVTPSKGYTLSEPVVSADGLTITFDVGYTGFEGGITNGNFSINIPAEASNIKKVTNAKADILGNAIPSAASDLPKYSVSFTCALDDETFTSVATKSEDKLTTITVELNNKLENDVNLVIADGSYLATSPAATDSYTVGVEGANGLTAAKQVIKAVGGAEATPQPVAGTVDLSDAVTKTVTDTPDETTKESDYFIIPKVTVTKDGETKDAAYGEDGDYVAVIGDGANETVLTPAQYSNLINGHLGADNVKDIVAANEIKDINDVVSKLKLRVYNKTAKVSAQLVSRENGEIQNAEDKEVAVEPAKDPSYTDPTLSAKASKSSTTAGSGDTITVTATYDKKDYAVDGVLTITVAEDVLDLATSTGFKLAYTKADGTKSADDEKLTKTVTELTDLADKGTVTITYKPGSVGTAKFDFKYVGKNEKGTEKEKKGSASTKINKASDNDNKGGSNSSSSSTGSTGIIARGNYANGTVTGGPTGLSDLNDAPWASEAITMLNYQNIVSGYEDGTFRPNGSITRAEYAQILINAIGHNGDSADTYFNDVPTDAWFYHNIAVASQLGIVQGYGDGNFGPYDLITREQMALMTQKAAQVMNVNLSAVSSVVFDDDADIADWSKAAVYELANAGIINGMGDGTFAPKDNATRAQASVIIYNTFVK